jgi:hypothetical protein
MDDDAALRILVCGSRTWSRYGVLAAVLNGIESHFNGNTVIINGKAPGADSYADKWAKSVGKIVGEDLLQFPADWNTHGRAAGPIRNRQMLAEGEPDVVWAFVDKPRIESTGTQDMIDIARGAGVPCYVVEAVV